MIEEVVGIAWLEGVLRKVTIRTDDDMLRNVQEFCAYEIEIETDKGIVVIGGCHDCGPEVIHALPHDSGWNQPATINDDLLPMLAQIESEHYTLGQVGRLRHEFLEAMQYGSAGETDWESFTKWIKRRSK